MARKSNRRNDSNIIEIGSSLKGPCIKCGLYLPLPKGDSMDMCETCRAGIVSISQRIFYLFKQHKGQMSSEQCEGICGAIHSLEQQTEVLIHAYDSQYEELYNLYVDATGDKPSAPPPRGQEELQASESSGEGGDGSSEEQQDTPPERDSEEKEETTSKS